MVEHQPSKLDMWVRFPSPAYARVAQLVERDLAKVEAAGSSPVSRFYFLQTICGLHFFLSTNIRCKKSLRSYPLQELFMNHCYPFFNTPLPYLYNSLEPFIDKKTMHLHHDKHLQTYIDNLNSLMSQNPCLQQLTVIFHRRLIRDRVQQYLLSLNQCVFCSASNTFPHLSFHLPLVRSLQTTSFRL